MSQYSTQTRFYVKVDQLRHKTLASSFGIMPYAEGPGSLKGTCHLYALEQAKPMNNVKLCPI